MSGDLIGKDSTKCLDSATNPNEPQSLRDCGTQTVTLGRTILEPQMWPCKCDPANVTLRMWCCECDPANVTLRMWPCECDSANVTLRMWPCECGPANVTLQMWPCECDPANLTPSILGIKYFQINSYVNHTTAFLTEWLHNSRFQFVRSPIKAALLL